MKEDQVWTEWFVRHMSGIGIRVKIIPSENAVEGQAGSVSQMIKAQDWQYELGKKDGVSVIRFHPSFVEKHEYLIQQSMSLKKYLESKIDERQASLLDMNW